MKIVLLVACILFTGTAIRADDDDSESKFIQEISELAGTCAEDVGLSKDDVKDLSNYENLDQQKVACMFSCMLTAQKIMADGKIQDDTVNEFVDRVQSEMEDKEKAEEFKKVTQNCVNDVRDIENNCDLAYQLLECVFRNMKE